MYFPPSLCASSMRYDHASNYQNCDTVCSLQELTIVTSNTTLHAAGFLDLPLVIEKIDLSVKICLEICDY